ncbi:mechanosensitive ion channel domain-containing protein [Ilumatobacter sp.]|uniref:mechanosensitive ion channel domain-containing protein n=1 Tax=Ilumatobacter sp. TaxID=1967498 RepID=UPI003AF911D4
MIDALTSWLSGSNGTAPFILAIVAVSAVVATRVSRVLIRGAIRRLAKRSRTPDQRSGGLWRARADRTDGESTEIGEQRRRQRIEAASRMVNHLVSVLIWILAGITVFHLLDINPAFFLSSAGFIGAGLAIGGQHKVNDYLTGLSVHFEDRYGVGDEIVADVGWSEPVRGVVDHVGLFSTRIRDQASTMHFHNSALVNVRNLSQEAVTNTIRLSVPDGATAGEAADVLRGLAGTDGLTDLVIVGDLEAQHAATGQIDVQVPTSRSLSDRSRERLVDRAEQAWHTPSRID